MKKPNKILSLILSISLLYQQSSYAQVLALDMTKFLTTPSAFSAADKFRPAHLRYFSYDTTNNGLKVLLDKGDSKDLSGLKLKDSTQELLRYFLIGVTLPDELFWVNLRPDAEDNIIDPQLARTNIGKIFLETDLQLKKDTALATSPQTREGKEYWDKLYKKANELFGSDNITIPTLTRPWIVPGEVILREGNGNVYIYKATLKVMLEQDHLKNSSVYQFNDPRMKALNEYSSQLIRELIIPKLTKTINTSKSYAQLRQVYYSLILARWFKARYSNKPGTYPALINRSNLTNFTSKENWSKTTYFKDYQTSFKNGEYNLKTPTYTLSGQTIRSYFSGGVALGADKLKVNLGPQRNTSSSVSISGLLGNNPGFDGALASSPATALLEATARANGGLPELAMSSSSPIDIKKQGITSSPAVDSSLSEEEIISRITELLKKSGSFAMVLKNGKICFDVHVELGHLDRLRDHQPAYFKASDDFWAGIDEIEFVGTDTEVNSKKNELLNITAIKTFSKDQTPFAIALKDGTAYYDLMVDSENITFIYEKNVVLCHRIGATELQSIDLREIDFVDRNYEVECRLLKEVNIQKIERFVNAGEAFDTLVAEGGYVYGDGPILVDPETLSDLRRRGIFMDVREFRKYGRATPHYIGKVIFVGNSEEAGERLNYFHNISRIEEYGESGASFSILVKSGDSYKAIHDITVNFSDRPLLRTRNILRYRNRQNAGRTFSISLSDIVMAYHKADFIDNEARVRQKAKKGSSPINTRGLSREVNTELEAVSSPVEIRELRRMAGKLYERNKSEWMEIIIDSANNLMDQLIIAEIYVANMRLSRDMHSFVIQKLLESEKSDSYALLIRALKENPEITPEILAQDFLSEKDMLRQVYQYLLGLGKVGVPVAYFFRRVFYIASGLGAVVFPVNKPGVRWDAVSGIIDREGKDAKKRLEDVVSLFNKVSKDLEEASKLSVKTDEEILIVLDRLNAIKVTLKQIFSLLESETQARLSRGLDVEDKTIDLPMVKEVDMPWLNETLTASDKNRLIEVIKENYLSPYIDNRMKAVLGKSTGETAIKDFIGAGFSAGDFSSIRGAFSFPLYFGDSKSRFVSTQDQKIIRFLKRGYTVASQQLSIVQKDAASSPIGVVLSSNTRNYLSELVKSITNNIRLQNLNDNEKWERLASQLVQYVHFTSDQPIDLSQFAKNYAAIIPAVIDSLNKLERNLSGEKSKVAKELLELFFAARAIEEGRNPTIDASELHILLGRLSVGEIYDEIVSDFVVQGNNQVQVVTPYSTADVRGEIKAIISTRDGNALFVLSDLGFSFGRTREIFIKAGSRISVADLIVFFQAITHNSELNSSYHFYVEERKKFDQVKINLEDLIRGLESRLSQSASSPVVVEQKEEFSPAITVVPPGDFAKTAAKKVGDEIVKLQRELSRDVNIVFATGRTQIGFLDELSKDERIDWSRVQAFHLDEYVGLSTGDPASFAHYLDENIFRKVSIPEANIHYIDGKTRPEDLYKYTVGIEERGGSDIVMLGIGRDGHLAFNEPPSGVDTRIRGIRISEQTIKDNASDYPGIGSNPHAYTLGIADILEGKTLFLLGNGGNKSEILRQAFKGSITAENAASFLRLHDDVVVILDTEAARGLNDAGAINSLAAPMQIYEIPLVIHDIYVPAQGMRSNIENHSILLKEEVLLEKISKMIQRFRDESGNNRVRRVYITRQTEEAKRSASISIKFDLSDGTSRQVFNRIAVGTELFSFKNISQNSAVAVASSPVQDQAIRNIATKLYELGGIVSITLNDSGYSKYDTVKINGITEDGFMINSGDQGSNLVRFADVLSITLSEYPAELFIPLISEAVEGDKNFIEAVNVLWGDADMQNLRKFGQVNYSMEYGIGNIARGVTVFFTVNNPNNPSTKKVNYITKKNIGLPNALYSWRVFVGFSDTDDVDTLKWQLSVAMEEGKSQLRELVLLAVEKAVADFEANGKLCSIEYAVGKNRVGKVVSHTESGFTVDVGGNKYYSTYGQVQFIGAASSPVQEMAANEIWDLLEKKARLPSIFSTSHVVSATEFKSLVSESKQKFGWFDGRGIVFEATGSKFGLFIFQGAKYSLPDLVQSFEKAEEWLKGKMASYGERFDAQSYRAFLDRLKDVASSEKSPDSVSLPAQNQNTGDFVAQLSDAAKKEIKFARDSVRDSRLYLFSGDPQNVSGVNQALVEILDKIQGLRKAADFVLQVEPYHIIQLISFFQEREKALKAMPTNPFLQDRLTAIAEVIVFFQNVQALQESGTASSPATVAEIKEEIERLRAEMTQLKLEEDANKPGNPFFARNKRRIEDEMNSHRRDLGRLLQDLRAEERRARSGVSSPIITLATAKDKLANLSSREFGPQVVAFAKFLSDVYLGSFVQTDPFPPDLLYSVIQAARQDIEKGGLAGNLVGQVIPNSISEVTLSQFGKTREERRDSMQLMSGRVITKIAEAIGGRDFRREVEKELRSGSSPVISQDTKGGQLGGIDLRTIPMLIQPMGGFANLTFNLPKLSNLESINLDKELKDIKAMVAGGIIPSGDRLKEYIAACYQKKVSRAKLDSLIPELIQICKLQEEDGVEADQSLKQALVLVDVI